MIALVVTVAVVTFAGGAAFGYALGQIEAERRRRVRNSATWDALFQEHADQQRRAIQRVQRRTRR